MKTVMKILLDYDDTVMIKNAQGEYVEHPLAQKLINEFNVTIYSGNPEAREYAVKFDIPFIFKGDDKFPKADVLIDDMADEYKSMGIDFFEVDHLFPSIDSFYKWIKIR